MITKSTKVQLFVFVVITLVGVTFTGARYANLDAVFIDDKYEVTAHFPDSGGAFVGSAVTYRGVGVGQLKDIQLTDNGVDLKLEIEKDYSEIPDNVVAQVASRSAVGEQYVNLIPEGDSSTYLSDGSEIAIGKTKTPVTTDEILTNLSAMVGSVDPKDLRTVVREFGIAFEGTGRDLQQLIDAQNSFIATADANFDVTRALIRDSNVVLRGQIASESALRTFATNFDLFSSTLAGADADLREVIDSGSATANELRTFLEDNDVDLTQILRNLRITGRLVVNHLDGIRHLLSMYPYIVEGGWTVAAEDPETGLIDAVFGLITVTEPHVCSEGYEGTDQRAFDDGDDIPLNVDARCTEPQAQTNARGAQHAPEQHPPPRPRVVASYEPETGTLTWDDSLDAKAKFQASSTQPPASLGGDSWKWLYMHPLSAP